MKPKYNKRDIVYIKRDKDLFQIPKFPLNLRRFYKCNNYLTEFTFEPLIVIQNTYREKSKYIFYLLEDRYHRKYVIEESQLYCKIFNLEDLIDETINLLNNLKNKQNEKNS